MNILHQIAYSDSQAHRFLPYPATQPFQRSGDAFGSDASDLWNDVLSCAVPTGFGSQCDLTVGMTPDFIDPRSVVDCTSPVKREASPYSPVSNGLNPERISRSISPSSDDHQDNSQTLGFHPSQFHISPLDIHPLFHPQSNAYPTTSSDNSSSVFMTPSHPQVDSSMNDLLSSSSTAKSGPPEEEKQLTPPPSPPIRRRGPGRPSKAQTAAQYPNNKRPTGHSAVKLRRQMHNDSAMRSRARLNNTLEELWNIIPKHERILDDSIAESDFDDNREVCRAVKVEVAIAYLKKLQTRLAGLESRISTL